MAKKGESSNSKIAKIKISRKGVHSKKKTSKNKSSKNYKKAYNSQGRRR
jgi:hypothetical protein